ncbi:MAG: DNA glycosylase [Lachnospiraceae bacterium]|nr:DNA glycosylase [Lachnospiraceae bacterium]
MTVYISDDFDLRKIAISGQCFRVKQMNNEYWRFICRDEVCYIKKLDEDGVFDVICDPDSWESFWIKYFDLDRDYQEIRESIITDNAFIQKAVRKGAGIRVLRQDPFEMLITFIISQRKSIPSIRKTVEWLSEHAGHEINTPFERLRSFPTAEELTWFGSKGLESASLGYRLPYIEDAIAKVYSGKLDLAALEFLDDEALFDELLKVHGVGIKVANCVCLFGYGRVARTPVDTWIRRMIAEECGGCDPFPGFGDIAGIIQQYVFYTEQIHKYDNAPKGVTVVV